MINRHVTSYLAPPFEGGIADRERGSGLQLQGPPMTFEDSMADREHGSLPVPGDRNIEIFDFVMFHRKGMRGKEQRNCSRGTKVFHKM